MEGVSIKALPIIRSVRLKLLPYWGNIGSIRQKNESAHSVVTRLDEEIEKYLSEELNKAYPAIEFVGEEFGGNREAKSFWIADPIDGTAHFIRGLPFCTTMLALIHEGKVVFSAIYDFVNDILYHAELGKGAFKDNEQIHVSDRPTSNSYVGLETHLDKPENMQKYLKIRKLSIMFNSVSAGYEYALVASGKLEGRVCFDPHGKDYDFAPGSLLVSEAGGVVANIGKETYNYRDVNFIASNKNVFEALTQGIDPIFPINA